MNFAIYGRKSVYSDHSDSVNNQFRMCQEYIDFRFPKEVKTVEQYSDEDYTGANTDRPDLQRLLSDIRAGAVDVLVVYQLDRLSRNVRDFSNIYSLLEEKHVMFVSIKENIDTATPIGKAMMYVTVVFAQMERETTAARVTDNMRGLAKKGYWTGGNPPIGYRRERITVDGKKHVMIVPDPEGVEYVTKLFDLFLDSKRSLQGMETYFRKEGIRTLSGAFFSTTQLHQILTRPFYVEATPEVYDYFENKGCQMATPREEWDGKHGVMVYGRTTQPKSGKHQKQPPEKWIVCVGIHEPFLPAEKWLAVQKRLGENKFDKNTKYDVPLLKGVIRCSCGSTMLVSRKKKTDGVSSWYYCLKRMRQGKEMCGRSQIKTDLLDEKVLGIFREIEADPAQIHKYIKISATAPQDVKAITAKVKAVEERISRLTVSLSLSENGSAAKYIVAEMERLDLELQALKRERNMALSAGRERHDAEKDVKETIAEISRLIKGLKDFSATEKNEIVKDVVKECVWDGVELKITL